MIEFGLIFFFGLASVTAAAFLARPWLRRSGMDRAGQTRDEQLRSALRTVGHTHDRIAIGLSVLVGLLLFLGIGFARPHHSCDPVHDPVVFATWIALSFLAGALVTVICARVGGWACAIAVDPALASIRTARTSMPAPALRAGAIAGLLASGLPLIAIAGFSAAAFDFLGGFTADPQASALAARGSPMLVLGYGFGACLAALCTRLFGGVWQSTTAWVAQRSTPHGASNSESIDPMRLGIRIAVSTHEGMGMCADVSASLAASWLACMLLLATAQQHNAAALPDPLSVLVLPLSLSAFGLFASAFGVMAVRTNTTGSPAHLLVGGFSTTAVLAAAALIALVRRTLGVSWPGAACAGLAGLVATAGVVAAAWLGSRRSPEVRGKHGLRRSLAGGAAQSWVGDAGRLRNVIVMVGWCAGAFVLSYIATARSDLDRSGSWGIALATLSMLTPATFLMTWRGAQITAQGAHAIEVESPATEICETHATAASSGEPFALFTGPRMALLLMPVTMGVALMAIVAMVNIVQIYAKQWPGRSMQPDALEPERMMLTAILGAVVVVSFCAMCLRAASRSGMAWSRDILERLSDHEAAHRPGTEGGASVAADSWYVLVLAREVARHTIPMGLAATALSLAVGIGLQFLTAHSGWPGATSTMVTWLVALTCFGLVFVAAFESNQGLLARFRGSGQGTVKSEVDGTSKWHENESNGVAALGDTVADPLNAMVSSSLHALIKLLVTVAVVLAPLFL